MKLREIYGPEINISGGLSNVSFGLPRRKLVNDVFVKNTKNKNRYLRKLFFINSYQTNHYYYRQNYYRHPN